MARKRKALSKEERTPLWRKMQEHYERATLSVCRVLCTGCGSMTVQGCRDILAYGDTCIRLAVCDPDARQIVILGEELLCLSYHPDAVRIKGRIRSVCFCCSDADGSAEWRQE